jgi:CBS domain-containing protein
MKASELMTRPLTVVTPSSELSDAVGAMQDSGVCLVTVVDDETTMHLVGIVTDPFAAVRCAARHHGDHCVVGNHMRREPMIAYADESASEVLDRMLQSDMGRLPVVDDLNRVIGIVSQGTLIEDVRLHPHDAPDELLAGV